MMRRRAAVGMALVTTATMLCAAGSGGAATHVRTVAFVTDYNTGAPRIQAIVRGGRLAARALGVHFVLGGVKGTSGAGLAMPFFQRFLARGVDAIATEGYDPQFTPIYKRIQAAGIPLLSAGDDIAGPRDVWVNMSSQPAYAQALADALASQLHETGEYAILEQQDETPTADRWGRLARSYIAKRYPAMTLAGVVRGTGAGDPSELASVEHYLTTHPRLKGLIGITPTESFMAAEAIIGTDKVGKVFAADNGGGDLLPPFPNWVRNGVAEFVYGGDQVKLGYLAVWAANWLLSGHTFRAGAYQVGGPVGLVWYYARKRELRLGPPLT